MNRREAREAGFEVDTNYYPWQAYRGNRFEPKEIRRILTDLEDELVRCLKMPVGPEFEKKRKELIERLEVLL